MERTEVREAASVGEPLITRTENQINPPLLLRATVTPQQREGQPSTSHGIRWREDTVDNEFLGRKKSNCCCIYNKPRRWDESSSSSSSSSDESENDDGSGKRVRHIHCTEHCRGHTKHCYRKKGAQQTETQQTTQPQSPENIPFADPNSSDPRQTSM